MMRLQKHSKEHFQILFNLICYDVNFFKSRMLTNNSHKFSR